MQSNITKNDARQRVWESRLGSLIDASDTYILELQRQLRMWLDELDQELANRVIQDFTCSPDHLELLLQELVVAS